MWGCRWHHLVVMAPMVAKYIHWPQKRTTDGKTSASHSASAVFLKLFKFVHHILLPVFSAVNCSFEPSCHSAGRSTSMRFQTSLGWANIHATCPCSAYCLGTQTGHKQDNLIVPCCVLHGLVLSGFADGGLSGVSLRTSSPDDSLEDSQSYN